MSFRRSSFAWCASALLLSISQSHLPQTASAQGFISSSTSRPFVTGLEPVVGRRGQVVGGILVNSKGLLKRATNGSISQLRRMRQKHLRTNPVPTAIAQKSKLRKISLRKLEEQIVRLRKKNLPLTEEIKYLAGLQSIQYVFIVPKQHDVVIAGYAEGWKVSKSGHLVGATTGRPVMNLDDLIIALRTAAASSVK